MNSKNTGLYRRIWSNYMRLHLKNILLAFFFMMIVGLCTASLALLMEPIFDKLFAEKEASLIPIVTAAFAISFSLRGISSFAQTVFLAKVSLASIQQMQEEMYAALMRSDLQYLHNEGTAKQLSRFTTDVLRLRQGMEQVLIGGKDIFTVCALIGAMFYTNWLLSIVAFIFFPAVIFPVQRIGKRLRKVSKEMQQEAGEMTSVLDDSLKNLKQSQSFNRQDHELKRGFVVFEKLKTLTFKSMRTRALSSPILESMNGVVMAATIAWGAYMVFESRLTQGEFFAFITAASLAYQPVRSLSNLWASIQEGLAAAERIFDVIDYQADIQSPKDAPKLTNVQGHIRLQNIDFSYKEEKILDHLTIDIKPGEKIALVGPSGAGKSTVLNLVPRFYDVTQGEILVDGQNIKNVDLVSLRDQVGLVSQEPGLFNDTIKNNILYGCPDATEAEIINAAKGASAHEFILNLPEGYDTVVGEFGVKLSGGQRQRISIARAMLKNAPILLLDEATSALDTESERKVQAALENLMKGRTSIVIAHRLSTIVNADRIYVMDKGRVIEQGKHAELLEMQGLYSQLNAMQKTKEMTSD